MGSISHLSMPATVTNMGKHLRTTRLSRRPTGWVALVWFVVSSVLPFLNAGALQVRPPEVATGGPGDVAAALLPGDLIRLSGTRESELSGDYQVDETGTVILPLVGTRNVRGIAAEDLKRELMADYRRQLRNQAVQIALMRRVRVLGAVKNPGIYHVDPTMTVADAIALAGGATQDGQLSAVRIIRTGKAIRSNVDRDVPVPGGIRSGDQIMVPERSWMSRNGKFVIGGLLSAVGIVVAASIR
jgi:protein involved in polysaccharide export with SLBB domain